MIRTLLTVALSLGSTAALAKLPPPTEAQQLKAEQAKAKTAWSDKVAAYQLCRAQERAAARYLGGMKSKGKDVPAPVPTAPCADPGPFDAPAVADAAKTAGGPLTAPVGAPSTQKSSAAAR